MDFLKSVFLSRIRRVLFEPLFHMRTKTPFLNYWEELERTQYLPEKLIVEKQQQRLRDLLRYVWNNNAFYRSRLEGAGITSETLNSPDCLKKIPLLSKEEIRSNTASMISRDFSRTDLLHFKTGGSTGKALDIFLSEECSEFRNSCARRHDLWTGWKPGEPIAAVWGNPCLPHGLKQRLKDWLLSPMIYLDTMHLSEASINRFADEWKWVRPTLLYGHAHSIYVLAQYVRNLNISVIKPRGILSTSMMLMPNERRTIEEVFGVKVTDRYGCEEVSLIASECERHEGLHLNIEHLYIEFIREDGTQVSPGEPGRIIVTDLMNRAMPFIRYQVEDVGVPSNRKCSCGRGLPLLASVTGRRADFLITRDGSKVAGVSLIENTLTKIPGIDQMQIIQESINLIVLRIVQGLSYKESSSLDLRAYFKGLFGDDTTVEIQCVTEILPENSGKYRFSICKIIQ
jgi:phenylacetate-CoA ligase